MFEENDDICLEGEGAYSINSQHSHWDENINENICSVGAQ